jgi:hypothetical protein
MNTFDHTRSMIKCVMCMNQSPLQWSVSHHSHKFRYERLKATIMQYMPAPPLTEYDERLHKSHVPVLSGHSTHVTATCNEGARRLEHLLSSTGCVRWTEQTWGFLGRQHYYNCAPIGHPARCVVGGDESISLPCTFGCGGAVVETASRCF